MKTFLRHAFALALLATAPARADDGEKPKGDLAKFQGTWLTKAGAEKDIDVVLTVEGKNCTVKVTAPDGQEFEMKGEFALDESAEPHKTITWTKFKNDQGEPADDNLGIYAFNGDGTLKICNGGLGKARPTEFKAGEAGPQLFELTRKPARKGADDPPVDVKGDLAKLQGDWSAKVGPEKSLDLTATFKGKHVYLTIGLPDGQEHEMKGDVTVDESAKPHRAISFKGFTHPDGTSAPESHAIYTFEGDTLKICTGGPGGERPTEFKGSDKATHPQLIVLTRKK